MWEQTVRSCQPGRGSHRVTELAGILITDFLISRTVRISRLSHPVFYPLLQQPKLTYSGIVELLQGKQRGTKLKLLCLHSWNPRELTQKPAPMRITFRCCRNQLQEEDQILFRYQNSIALPCLKCAYINSQNSTLLQRSVAKGLMLTFNMVIKKRNCLCQISRQERVCQRNFIS